MLLERRSRGLSAPALDKRVDLDEHLVWVWNAFQQLSTCRAVGMSLGPIPWTAINDWARRHGILDEDDFEELRYLVSAMDETYLAHLNKRQQLNKEQRKPSQGPERKLQ